MSTHENHNREPSPVVRFATVLVLVFVADLVGERLTATLAGNLPQGAEEVLATVLLALTVAAPIWWLVIRPLRGEAAAERARAAAVVVQAAEGIVTVDEGGRITSFNPAAERMFRLSEGAALGRPWSDLVPTPDPRIPEGCAVLLPRLRTDGGPASVETEARRADGTAFAAEVAISPLGSGLACLVRDVSERKASERALRESRAMLHLVLNAIPVGVFWKDRDSVYLGCNGDCARDAGLEHPSDIVGKTDFDIAWRDHADLYRADDREVMTTGAPKVNYEEPLTRPDGSRIWLQTSKVPLTDAHGNVVGVMGCYADITERKRAEEALERTLVELEDRVRQRTAELEAANLRLTREVRQRRAMETRLRLFRGLLDGSHDGLFVLEAETGRLLDVNQAARESLGYSRRALLAMHVWDFEETVPDLETWKTYLDVLASGGALVGEGRHRRADGGVFPVEVHAAHIQVDDARYIVAVARDITARKQAEAELVTAKEKAERADRAKSAFLSRMSHELRTPMNAMLGFAQLMGSNPAEPLTPGQRRFAEEILRAGRHLLTLVNEMLDLARIEAGTLDLEVVSIPLWPLAEEAATLLLPLARELRVTVDNRTAEDPRPWVRADPTRLKEALINLVSNAIKYNREGGRVTLSAEPRPDGRVAVTVADTGPGIPPDKQDRLFEPFDRLDMESTGVEGTGIGLAITRHLIAAMGGEVTLESTPGAGTRFTVVLPAGEPQGAPPEGPVEAAEIHAIPAPGPRTVLYIEDNPANMALVEEIFRARPDVMLLSASRGQTGVETARRAVPDLILLDLNLPDLSGFEVLERLRSEAATRAIPVVGVSANSFPEDVERARRAGFSDYVTKPFNVRQFLATVDGALTADPDPHAPGGWNGDPASV